MAVGGGGDLGGAHIEISGNADAFFETLKRIDAAVNATAANINKKFERAGIAGSPGLEKIRENLEQVGLTAAQVGKAVEELRREFGKPIEFKDPGSSDRLMVGIQEATRLLGTYEQQLTRIDQVARERELLPDVAVRREELIETIQSIREQLGRLRTESQDAFNLPNISRTQKEIQGLAKIQEAAIQENQRFDESLQLKNAGLPELTKGEQAIQKFGAVQEKAIQENQKFDESLRLKSAGVPQLDQAAKSIQAFGKVQAEAATEQERLNRLSGEPIVNVEEVVQAEQELRKLVITLRDLRAAQERGGSDVIGQAIQQTEERVVGLSQALGQADVGTAFSDLEEGFEKTLDPGTQFDALLDGLNEKLQSVGLSVSGVSVLLGAGFAGGLAGIIKIAIDLGAALIGAVSEIRKVDKATQFAFGGATEDIRNFADEVQDSTGRTRTEILKTANTFAQLGRAIGLTRKELPGFSQGFAEFAAQIEKFIPTVEGIEGAAGLIARVIEGDREAIAELGFTFEEVNDIVQNKFGKNLDVLSAGERILLANALAARAAAAGVGEFGEKSVTLGDRFRGLRDDFLGFFSEDLVERMARAREGFEAFLRAPGTFTGDRGLEEGLEKIKGLSDKQLATLRAEFVANKQIRDAIDAVTESRKKNAEAIDQQSKANEANIDVMRLNTQEFLANTGAVRQLEDGLREMARTQEDSTRRIADSLRELERAREDAALREQQVRRDNLRGIDDANRQITDANIQLARALEDQAREIEEFWQDHNRRVEDLRTKREEADLDHRRSIEDINRDHNRALEDFAAKEKEVREQEVRDATEALVAIEDAQRRRDANAENAARRNLARQQKEASGEGDAEGRERDRIRELEDFKRDMARANEDRIRKLAELEREDARIREDRIRELGRIEVETNRAIVDAHRQVQEALIQRQRAVEDAITSLHEMEMENNRALFDAQRGVEEAHREAKRAIDDNRRSLERLFEDYGLSLDILERIIVGHQQWRSILEDIAGLQQFSPAFSHSGGAGDLVLGRQHGGPFRSGQPFVAGEGGLPELILPGEHGLVASNKQILKALQAMGGGLSSGQSINVFEVANDPEATAFAVAARLTRGVNN